MEAEAEGESGGVAEIVLAVIGAVGELRQEILGLDGADCNVARQRHVNSASGCAAEGGLRAQDDCIRRPDGTQENLGPPHHRGERSSVYPNLAV